MEWKGDGSVVELSLRLNLRRRHLNESQRAMVAARLAKMMQKLAGERKRRHIANLQSDQRWTTSGRAAARVNVSQRLACYAIRVLDHGSPELIAEVDSGDFAVSAASVLTRLPKQEQAQAVGEGLRALAAKVRELSGRQGQQAADRPALGCFGVLEKHEPERRTSPARARWRCCGCPPNSSPRLSRRSRREASTTPGGRRSA